MPKLKDYLAQALITAGLRLLGNPKQKVTDVLRTSAEEQLGQAIADDLAPKRTAAPASRKGQIR